MGVQGPSTSREGSTITAIDDVGPVQEVGTDAKEDQDNCVPKRPITGKRFVSVEVSNLTLTVDA